MDFNRLTLWIALILYTVNDVVSAEAVPQSQSAVLRALTAAQSNADPAVLRGLVQRVLGDSYVDQILFDVNPPSWPQHGANVTVQIAPAHSGARVHISATSPVEAAFGLNNFLRTNTGFMYAWDGEQRNTVPQMLPLLETSTTFEPNLPVRYFSNVCTFSYSFLWWDWADWERFIDWLALNSFNAPLAHVGQEAVWRRTWLKFGMSAAEIAEHFTGPAFLAWERMGNLKRFGGPLSSDWHAKQEALQKKIVQRMTDYGMVPVLPAFSGHIPTAVRTHYPTAKISKVGCWIFDSKYSCLDFLDPIDPLFQTIGDTYMQEMNSTYGLYGLYSADPFNEMSPSSYAADYVAAVGSGIYNGMSHIDNNAVWVMQAWFLLGGWDHWMNKTGGQTPPAETLFTAVPMGNLLLLDLYSEAWPVYEPAGFYYGQPYVFNVLHNFGGKMEMFGGFNNVDQCVTTFLNYPTNATYNTRMGFGLTMEGIFQNYPQYQFSIDRFWSHKPIDINKWTARYATERYGLKDLRLEFAWKILAETIYNRPFGPQLNGNFNDEQISKFRQSARAMNTTFLIDENSDYSPFSMMFLRPRVDMTNHYKEAGHEPSLNESDLFLYDLADLTRQVLLQIGTETYISGMFAGYKSKNVTAVIDYNNRLNVLFQDMDRILKTDRRFLLGKWIDAARNKSNTSEFWLSTLLARQYEYNMRNQVTLWGPNGQILDYARKQWSGLIIPYYKARWTLFGERMIDALHKNQTFDERLWYTLVRYQVELPFAELIDNAPNVPVGNTVQIAKQLHEKYFPAC